MWKPIVYVVVCGVVIVLIQVFVIVILSLNDAIKNMWYGRGKDTEEQE